MPFVSLTFDDDDETSLDVFSGEDLLTAHYDQVDLDWEEVAERSIIDERRGLVITQVGVLDDVLDEYILYMADPVDVAAYRRKLDSITTGPRLDRFEHLMRGLEIRIAGMAQLVTDLRTVIAVRNRLTHGTIYRRPTRMVPIADWPKSTIELEWVLLDRRDRTTQRVSMAGLRQTLNEAQGCVMGLLDLAERFVEIAPRPRHFPGGAYLGPGGD